MRRFLVLLLVAFAGRGFAMECNSPVVDPKPVHCSTKLEYCEYLSVYCTGIRKSMSVKDILSSQALAGGFMPDDAILSGRCNTLASGGCPSADKCIDPQTADGNLSHEVRTALRLKSKIQNVLKEDDGASK